MTPRITSPVILLVGVISTVLLPGLHSCEGVETCDGLDNDADGYIDEDFDSDLDGHDSSEMCLEGDDCDDSDPAIGPGQPEVTDGLDNDCDGLIDETPKPYTFKFVAAHSGLPIKGVAVFVGLDGKGPSGRSDSEGTVTLDLEQPVQDWSYAYHMSSTHPITGEPQEVYEVFSFQSNTLEAYTQVEVEDGAETFLTEEIHVTVTGLDASGSEAMYLITNATSLYEYPLETSISTSIVQRTDQEPYLLGYQLPPCTLLGCSMIPERFGALRESSSSVELPLDRTFDRTLSVSRENVSPYAFAGQNMVILDLAADYAAWFMTETTSLASPEAQNLPFPDLVGGLEGAELRVGTAVFDGKSSQAALVSMPIDSVCSLSLPPMAQVANDYEPLSLQSLPGTSLDIANDLEAEYDWMQYGEVQLSRNDAAQKVKTTHRWTVVSDPSRALTFPVIPEGLFAFVEAEDAYQHIFMAWATAEYSPEHSESGETWSTVNLDLAVMTEEAREESLRRPPWRLNRSVAKTLKRLNFLR